MNKKILVVENEQTTRVLAKTTLESVRYSVDTAENGLEALNLIVMTKYDLIMSDVEMPVMDGVDLYRRLKSGKKTASIPIIIITSDKIFRDAFSHLGVDGFIPKPLGKQIIIDKVRKVIGPATKIKKELRVLIAGSDKYCVDSMDRLLAESGCDVIRTKGGRHLIIDAVTFSPNIIIMDIMMKEIPSVEIIKCLNALSIFRDTHIVAYSYFSPEQLGDVENAESLKDLQERCVEAGVTKYIGRFSKEVFLDSLRDFGV